MNRLAKKIKKATKAKKLTITNGSSNIKQCLSKISNLRKELSKIIVGQEKVIDGMIKALIANGHVLVEGVPGIAKTLIIRSIAHATGCNFGRIQFTVDLLPSDIVGITTLSANKSSFQVLKGPIFNNFVIADEINRSPPKTQSALLEAMGEKQVSISKITYKLDLPFFVMATQNSLESSGTYPLPEAQVDRFLFKLMMTYPEKHHEAMIIEQNIAFKPFEAYGVKKAMGKNDILKMQKLVHTIKHTDRINKYIVNIVNATRSPKEYSINLGKYISLGASPRASIFLFTAGKADAFLQGKMHVSPQNIKNVALDVLRHRIMLNYRANVDHVTAEDIIREILDKVRVP